MNRFAPFEERRDIWLNDIAFSNVDELGNRWIIEDIEGWWDLPTPTMGEVDRAYSEDGSFYEPGRFESRVIRLRGRILPPNRSTNANNLARQAFNKRLQLVRRTGLLRVLESPELGGGKQSEVVIVARPLVSAKQINGTLEFDVQLRAPDPRKYSVDLETAYAFIYNKNSPGRTYDLTYMRTYSGVQASSTVNLNNRGDYNTYGVLRFHGPVDNPTAIHVDSGKSIGFSNLRITTGQYLDVNLRDKTVLMNTGLSLRERMTPDSQWFVFDPGINRVSYDGIQYIPPVEEVPKARNLVTNPSFEYAPSGDDTITTVRRNFAMNSSGSYRTLETDVYEYLTIDSQGKSKDNFSTGAVTDGVITDGPLTFKNNGTDRIPSNGKKVYAQVEVSPTTTAVTSAELKVGTEAGGFNTSGPYTLTKDQWTKIRVDTYVQSTDFSVVLSVPGVSSTDTVNMRNAILIRTSEDITGNIDFEDVKEGFNKATGVQTSYDSVNALYRRSTIVPDYWTLPNNDDAKFIVTGDSSVTLVAGSTPEHTIDFGPSLNEHTDFQYGVTRVGDPISIDLYDDNTGDLLVSTPYVDGLLPYETDTPVVPRVQLVTTLGEAGTEYTGIGITMTADGGTTVFTDTNSENSGYIYQPGDQGTQYSAYEAVRSYTKTLKPSSDGYNLDSTIVSTTSKAGSKSLAIRFLQRTIDDSLPTPISGTVDGFNSGTYYVTVSFNPTVTMSFDLKVMGLNEDSITSVTAQEGRWTTIRVPIEVIGGQRPSVEVVPTNATPVNSILHVDCVGILDADIEYFDGSSGPQYRWNGTPNRSTSDTIVVAGVPKSKLEIMYRSAWIG